MGGISDEVLFRRLLDGDGESLNPLLNRYGDALTIYINGYIHDLDMAEDLMIEAFSRMLAKEPRLREGGFKPYLYKTARNLALRHLERNSRTFSIENLDLDPVDEKRVEETVFSTDTSRIVRECLEMLPADSREALFLVYIEDMSYEQAAIVMRKTRKQVDNLVSRGKASMKPLLAKRGVNGAL